MGYLETALAIWGGCAEEKPSFSPDDEKPAKECERMAPASIEDCRSDRDEDLSEALRFAGRTPWNTLAWSDPSAPALEAFGPAPDLDAASPVPIADQLESAGAWNEYVAAHPVATTRSQEKKTMLATRSARGVADRRPTDQDLVAEYDALDMERD